MRMGRGFSWHTIVANCKLRYLWCFNFLLLPFKAYCKYTADPAVDTGSARKVNDKVLLIY